MAATQNRRSRLIRGTVAALALAGVLAASAQAGEWTEPRKLTAIGGPACKQLVVNARGDAVAAWVSTVRGKPSIRASFRAAGGPMRRSVRISGRGRLAPTSASCVSVTLDEQGRALVVWGGVEPARRGLRGVIVANELRERRWGGARRVAAGSDPVAANTGPRRWVVAHSSGLATDRAGMRLGVLERWRGRWRRVRAPRSSFVNQKVIAGGTRGVAVVWTEEHDTARVNASTRRGRGRFTRRQLLSDPAVDSVNPRVVIDAAGRALAAWNAASSPIDDFVTAGAIDVASASTGRPWSARRTVSGPDEGARLPSLAANAAGQAIVAWNRVGESATTIEAALGTTAGDFGAIEELARNSGGDRDVSPTDPDAAISSSGLPGVAWSTDNLEVFAALRGADATWTRSPELTRGTFGHAPALGIGRDGSSTVIWASGAGVFTASCDCG